MRTSQVLPYLAGLLLLAWILGTLARSGTSGAGILSNSFWLVYLVYMLPILALVVMVATVVFLVVNWKLISDMLGFGMAARKKQVRKQSDTLRLIIWMGFWGIALATLYWKCGGLICRPDSSSEPLPDIVANIVDAGPGLNLPSLAGLSGPIYALADIMTSPVFSIAFLGLLLVSTMILARGFKVSLDETRNGRLLPGKVQEEGASAVQDALKILENRDLADPRTRIMICYGRMVRAAAGLGANVSVDQTARELERGIRGTFRLKGDGIAELTRLFEEARYSLHKVGEKDSDLAHECLAEIGQELTVAMTLEN